MNYDAMTIGRWPARSQQTNKLQVSSPAYRVLFTRGDELLTPPQYRGSFDSALERAITGNMVNVNDTALAKAFSVSATSYACTEYGANIIGNLPLKVVDLQDNLLTDSPLTYFQKNSAGILADVIRGLWIWGRVYLRKRRNAQGWPTGLEWLNPQKVREINPANGDHTTVIGYDIEAPSHRYEPVAVDEIVYLQLFDTDPFGQGISKFEAAWRAVNVEQSIVTYAAAFFINGAQPDGFLSFDSPLTDAQLLDARTEWQRNFKGVKNAHRTAVMPGGASWTSMQAVPKDLAMIELKDSEREDICAIWGIDPVLVGLKGTADPLSANSTYNSAEIAFVRRVALPLLNTVILPALNKQWARKSFDRSDYTLAVDTRKIEVLNESYLAQSDTAIKLSDATVLDYNEGRDLLGYDSRLDYYRRNTTEALANWQGGTITLGQYHKLVGTPGINPLDPNLNVININGTLLPYVQLAQVALKNVEKLSAPPPQLFGGAGGFPTPPQLPPGGDKPPENPSALPSKTGNPQLPAPKPEVQPPQRAMNSGVAFLGGFSDNAEILLVQDLLRGVLPEAKFNEPDTLHVTLAISEDCGIQDAKKIAAKPEMFSVLVDGVGVFDTPDGYAIHLTVRKQNELLTAQKELVSTIEGDGFTVSDYSAADAYKPHITLAYSTKPFEPFSITPFALTVNRIEVYDSDQVLSDTWQLRSNVILQQRAGMPLTVAISFADNQFVRYARRALSEALTTVGVKVSAWAADNSWRIDLASAESWTPNAVSNFLRNADYSDTRKLDLHAIGYEYRDGAIFLSVEGDLSGFQKALAIDTATSQINVKTAVSSGICMATVESVPTNLPIADWPLVASNLTLYLGDVEYHQWNLRGVSTAQTKELTAWRKAIGNKGANYQFKTHALTGQPIARFIQDALAVAVEADEHDNWITAVFEQAEKTLKADSLRSYADTREQFYSDILAFIRDAQANDINRANFAGRMRSALRRYGLLAFRDGMNEVGYDPESFSPQEVNTFSDWQALQSSYVTGFGAEIFKQGITENEIAIRARMWSDVSLQEIYYRGVAAGQPVRHMRWNTDIAAEHCETCLALDGQVHTMQEWIDSGFLPGHNTECGPGCKCGLVFTNENVKGTFAVKVAA